MLTDLHCHIIPGVDDGARNMNESVRMLKAAKAAGIGRIVATPHIYHLRAERGDIISAYEALRTYARAYDIEMRLGYEVNWRAIVSTDWESIRSLAVEGTRALLLELPNRALFPSWEVLVPEMCRHMTTVLVHPERYIYFQRDITLLDRLRDAGCKLQIDANALVGGILREETRFCRRLLKTRRADYIASDAHSADDYALYARALAKFKEYMPMPNTLERFESAGEER